MQLVIVLVLTVFSSCVTGQTTEAPNYFCTDTGSTTIFTLSSLPHSAWQSTSNCSLQQCQVNSSNNNSCRSSETPCFDYRTLSNTRYCAPGILCSILEPCNNITYACASTTSVCVINSCCSPQPVCLPMSVTNFCISDALSLFGVQFNLDPSSLPSGWSVCYTATYATDLSSSVVATVLASCSGSKLLLGCRPVGTTFLTVAAMGNRADVLYNCSTSLTCSNTANGVAWYFSDSYSWGFAQGGDTVYRNTCDTGTTNNASRLCWHTLSPGGWRCGATINLSTNTTWEKVIYQSN